MALDVTVEVPFGERNKYEIDHHDGRIRLDRQLFTATRYPAEYGFLSGTLGRDGDPLDALVLTDAPTFPGCVISARPIGMFVMDDEHGSDNKIVTVPAGDPRWERLQDIGDLPTYTRAEIQHFFEVYKQLEPGKRVTGTRWATLSEALLEIDDATERHRRGTGVAPSSTLSAGTEDERRQQNGSVRGVHYDEQVTGPQLDRRGPPRDTASTHVVLGYRDTALGQAVLRVGVEIAGRLHAELHVVHVVDLHDYPIDVDAWDWETQAQRHLGNEQRQVENALATMTTSWTYHAAHGSPVALLRQVADTHDALMFIVGSRGEGPSSIAARLLAGRGAVSHGLIARSHRPVLVVPPRAAQQAYTTSSR